MRYKVGKFEIRSENAAKPVGQAAKPLLQWLRKMKPMRAALDYGCGKLRYSDAVARKCRNFALVDSEVQLDRLQKLGRNKTSVRKYARKRWPRCRILTVEQFHRDRRKYDFVLCANVLSAIPDETVRSKTLTRLASALRGKGRCLFVAQYQNSYFKKVAASPLAIPHLDGWVLRTKRGSFYYGLLDRQRLTELVAEHGFRIQEAWAESQSAYVLAGKDSIE